MQGRVDIFLVPNATETRISFSQQNGPPGSMEYFMRDQKTISLLVKDLLFLIKGWKLKDKIM